MALRVATIGAVDYRLAANILKTANYDTPRTIGGVSARYGHWMAGFVQQGSPANGNTVYQIWGSTGSGSANNNSTFRIGGDTTGTANDYRPYIQYRTLGTEYYGSTFYFTGVPAVPLAQPVFHINGVNHIEVSPGVFEWRAWAAWCQVGGTVYSEVRTTQPDSAWLASGTGQLFGRVLFSEGTAVSRTRDGTVVEHIALVDGAFPWDSANNRPHHDAIAALAAASGASTFYTYAQLVAAQNAGTLPFANCIQGKGDLRGWWTLESKAAGGPGLVNNGGSAGTATLTASLWNGATDDSGIQDVSPIAPEHWSGSPPTITAPNDSFFGGRGARAVTIAGTGTENVERRWVYGTGAINGTPGAVVPGFNWATRTVAGNAWSTADVLPVGGPYRLEVRYVANTALSAFLDDVIVGTVAVFHAQSGIERLFSAQDNNVLGIAAAAGALGKVNWEDTGNRLAARFRRILTGGTTPATVQSGMVALLNEWSAAFPGHPLHLVNIAVSGSNMANDWVANATITTNYTYLGAVQDVASAIDGGGSGVMGRAAWQVGQYCDVHVMMWTPGLADDGEAAAMTPPRANRQAVWDEYVAATDARFSNSATAPWLVFPPWRADRTSGDSSATVAKRQDHLLFVERLGARGWRGPFWADTIADANGSLHAATNSALGVPNASTPVSDANHVGTARICRGIGRSLAWVFNPSLDVRCPVTAAWTDNAHVTVNVELGGRPVRTLNGAAIANLFYASTDNGATWGAAGAGFTVALSADGTRAVLTPDAGTRTAWAAAGANLRIDFGREWPFTEAPNDETTVETTLHGLLYDEATHRGGTNLATQAGNVLEGSNRTGAGSGVAVTTRGARKLVSFERRSGTVPVTVEMRQVGTGALLASKQLVVATTG